MKNNKSSKDKKLTDKKLMEIIVNDRKIRAAISRADHFWFFNIYFPHYLSYPPALFHREMFKLTQRDDLKLLAIMAFRNSGKSTIMNLSYSLWSVLGKFQKKFVVIVSQTRSQAEGHFSNILYELKNNDRLSSDLGPFEVNQDPYSVLLKRLNAKIMFMSRSQRIRGMRHGPHRPSLIILDDIEDSKMIESELDRKVTYEWFETEIIPAGDSNTTIVVLGNLLHEDSLMMRIRINIRSGKTPGIFKAYPLLDDLDQILWPEKFTEEDIKRLKEKTSDELVWRKEYLLRVQSRKALQNMMFGHLRKDSSDEENYLEETTVRLEKYVISAPILEAYALVKYLNKMQDEDDKKNENTISTNQHPSEN